ncbi:YihY/virulence factor BrkB family protein [Demequina aurantiaca]|uniref:YihY/virulence factor BrkB family protein n=1 Tax=Demequina aurantiaca TaxID=676200 RepID=UPI003D3575DC
MALSSRAGADSRSKETGTDSDPSDEGGPDAPTDVPGPGWAYTARKAFREFLTDQCTDLAAALTYYAVLAIFPALIAIFALLGVFGQGQQTVDTVVPILNDVLGQSGADTLTPVIETLATAPGAGLAVILGLLVSLWSASGYVTAFGRAMNRVYEVDEGRPVYKLRPIMLLITLIVLVLVVLVALMLVLSGPVATAIGEALGLSTAVVAVWQVVKWPVVLVLVMLIVAILYYTTPNVKQPKFRWISVGAVVAIVAWAAASAAFGFYIANFSNYGKTYGAFAGVIIFLLWLWITNLALLFGAEVDAELERTRELLAGTPAEEEIQLPVRDDTKILKDQEKDATDVAKGRELRQNHGESDES